MQTLTIAINNSNALKTLQELEEQHFISIVQTEDMDSPAFPGKRLSMSEFRKWIIQAEGLPTISYEDAKSTWASKRKQLQQLTR